MLIRKKFINLLTKKTLNFKINQLGQFQIVSKIQRICSFNKFQLSSLFYPTNYIKFNFSSSPQQKKNTKKDQKNQNKQQKESQQNFNDQQQSLINTHKPNQIFNTLINQDPNHNFQKQLIIAKKIYERSTKQLRASILFQDLLKTQIKINIYDTKAKPYNHWWMKNLFNIFFFALTVWFLKSISNTDPKNKVILQRTTGGKALQFIMYAFASWFLIIGFFKYLKFQRRFVEKIVYDTQKENFIFTKRKFFGGRVQKQISRYKIVYTQNQFLNSRGTNYFHLDTQEQYSIPYKQYWIKQDLFSHLIAQRIKI